MWQTYLWQIIIQNDFVVGSVINSSSLFALCLMQIHILSKTIAINDSWYEN